MKYNVLIATKGRAGLATTVDLLIADGIVPILFVEPQEYLAYQEAYPSALIFRLEKSDQGVSYVRRVIQNYARAEMWQWYWMLDDDIKQFYLVENGKCVKAKAIDVLTDAESVIESQPNVAIGALEYQQYAWSAKKECARNSYCDVAVLVNVQFTKTINYRDNCKEDRDFVLQILSAGYDSVRSTWTAFSAPKNGSNKGGLHEAYKSGLENHWSARMCQLWPGVCEPNVKKDGRPDVKIHWRQFKRQ